MKLIIYAAVMTLILCTTDVFAHTPFMACYDNGDTTITCYGEFSDGSIAAAIPIQVVSHADKILSKGVMDDIGEFTFNRPQQPFTVIFDAGAGHIVKEKSTNISE